MALWAVLIRKEPVMSDELEESQSAAAAQELPGDLGRRVRHLRERLGWSRAELAERAATSDGYLEYLETRPAAAPSSAMVARLPARSRRRSPSCSAAASSGHRVRHRRLASRTSSRSTPHGVGVFSAPAAWVASPLHQRRARSLFRSTTRWRTMTLSCGPLREQRSLQSPPMRGWASRWTTSTTP